MTDLIQLLGEVDQRIFYWINVSLAHPYLDVLFTWITNKKNWYVPGALLWIWLIWKGGRNGRILALLVILALVLADQISSSILKPGIGRLRPCKTLEGFRLLVHCGSRYGFPSSHASNIAAIAGLFSLTYRRGRWFWLVLAVLIGLSRVYVGVHYPFDVLCGWLLGGLIALGLVKAAGLRTRLAAKDRVRIVSI